MAQPGETKAFLMENATTEIYSHVEKEISATTVDDAETVFTVTTAPAAVTGIVSGSPQSHYKNGDDFFRKDVLVLFRKDGKDTPVDTTINAITISGTDITFATAPVTTEADDVVVSYSHTKSDRSDEIVNLTPAGGGRPVEWVTVQGGEKVRIEKTQEAKTVSLEVLSVDGGFVEFVNGTEISETIAGTTSGSDVLKGSLGAETRSRKTIICKVTDPETDNDRIECFFNVVGVSDEGSAPSDGYWAETCGFECPPQDYCRITRLVGQG